MSHRTRLMMVRVVSRIIFRRVIYVLNASTAAHWSFLRDYRATGVEHIHTQAAGLRPVVYEHISRRRPLIIEQSNIHHSTLSTSESNCFGWYNLLQIFTLYCRDKRNLEWMLGFKRQHHDLNGAVVTSSVEVELQLVKTLSVFHW